MLYFFYIKIYFILLAEDAIFVIHSKSVKKILFSFLFWMENKKRHFDKNKILSLMRLG